MRQTPDAILLAAALLAAVLTASAGYGGEHGKIPDIEYGRVGGHQLLLDLYLPQPAKRPVLVVFVHGGAWKGGSKARMPWEGLLDSGFAIASVDYRLSPIAKFPAQVHDIKAAIRFLRAREEEHGYDARKIAIAGSSAGGHLAALVGVTNGHPALEGHVGDHPSESSEVQAIVSYYGASNLLTILDQSTPHGLGVRVPALELLLGSRPEENPELAQLASPIAHVDHDDPPLLLLHGDHDRQMPVNQSLELYGKYQEFGRSAQVEFVFGAGHGGRSFFDSERTKLVADFLRSHLDSSK